MNKKKFYIYSLLIIAVFIAAISFSGIFKIGILSDTFSDAYTAVNSSAIDKITNNLEYIDEYRYRPVLFLTLKGIVNINRFLGFSYDNFILYKLINIFLYLSIAFLSGFLVLKFSGNIKLSVLTEAVILIFPNNLHNLCWSAAYFEILCGIFYLLALIFILKYVNNDIKRFLIYSEILFVFALLTKEIAITFPFVCAIILYIVYGKIIFSKFKSIYIYHLVILILYFVLKNFLSRGIPVISGRYFEEGFWANSFQIILKGIVSTIIPLDFSLIRIKIKEFDVFLFIYMVFVFIFMIVFIYKLIKQKRKKLFFLVCLNFFILIAPNIYAGYIRPQLILIPFVLTIILFLSFFNIKSFNLKLISFVIIIFWLILGYKTITGWENAYSEGKERVENVLKKDFTSGKKIIIIGNPSRVQQCFMYDNIMFSYNYFKYHDFIIKDTLSDIIRTVALDEESLNSVLRIINFGNNEYEISCMGKTQFFYLSGDELQIEKNNGLQNDLMSVKFLEYNNLNKPIKIRVKIISDNTEKYIFKGKDLIKVN